jgi:hypothetical protein
MSKSTLWEYVLIQYPKDEKLKPAVIKAPTQVLATSEQNVHKIAAREIPEAIDVEEVTIAVRPF